MLSDLPYAAQIHILQHLNRPDSFQLARTCHKWFQLYQSPIVWRHLELSFFDHLELDEKKLLVAAKYGQHVQSLLIELDQSQADNRRLAVLAIERFVRLPRRQLERLVVRFTGENPLFYGGQEFNLALHSLFGLPPEGSEVVSQLKFVDLELLPIMYTDEILYSLAANHSQLRHLNIQNKQLVCKIQPDCVRTLVQRCRQLEDLRLFHSSLADAVLLEFTTAGRAPLQHLSIFCRRQDKFTPDLTQSAWNQLVEAIPQLKVTLKIDHTCPLSIMSAIMKPNIPVTNLNLETYTKVVAKLKLAHRYVESLRGLEIRTQPTREFELFLLQFVQSAVNLQSLKVTCGVLEETAALLFTLGKNLIPSECDLKSNVTEESWVGDAVWDEIRDDWK